MLHLGKDQIPWNWLGEPGIALHYTGWFAQSLLWGILYPNEAQVAVDTDRSHYEKEASSWREHGLEVSPQYPWPSNESFFQYCEELVNNFEAQRRPLADTPAELLSEPRIASRLQSNSEIQGMSKKEGREIAAKILNDRHKKRPSY